MWSNEEERPGSSVGRAGGQQPGQNPAPGGLQTSTRGQSHADRVRCCDRSVPQHRQELVRASQSGVRTRQFL